jgi:hypothetical protein
MPNPYPKLSTYAHSPTQYLAYTYGYELPKRFSNLEDAERFMVSSRPVRSRGEQMDRAWWQEHFRGESEERLAFQAGWYDRLLEQVDEVKEVKEVKEVDRMGNPQPVNRTVLVRADSLYGGERLKLDDGNVVRVVTTERGPGGWTVLVTMEHRGKVWTRKWAADKMVSQVVGEVREAVNPLQHQVTHTDLAYGNEYDLSGAVWFIRPSKGSPLSATLGTGWSRTSPEMRNQILRMIDTGRIQVPGGQEWPPSDASIARAKRAVQSNPVRPGDQIGQIVVFRALNAPQARDMADDYGHRHGLQLRYHQTDGFVDGEHDVKFEYEVVGVKSRLSKSNPRTATANDFRVDYRAHSRYILVGWDPWDREGEPGYTPGFEALWYSTANAPEHEQRQEITDRLDRAGMRGWVLENLGNGQWKSVPIEQWR